MKATILLGLLAAIATNPLTCSQPVYLPNKIQTPIFHESGTVFASASYTGNSGFGGTLAYTPVKSFFVEVGGNMSPEVKPFTSNNSTKFIYGELGYYNCPTPAIELELSGGYGKGTSEVYDNFPENVFDTSYYSWYNGSGNEFDHKNVNYDRFHLQASFGVHGAIHESAGGNHENDLIMEFALTPRVTYLQTSKYFVEHFDTSHVLVASRNESFSNAFLEFGATLRVGFEHLMIEVQAGSASYLGATQPILTQGSFLSVGLVSRF